MRHRIGAVMFEAVAATLRVQVPLRLRGPRLPRCSHGQLYARRWQHTTSELPLPAQLGQFGRLKIAAHSRMVVCRALDGSRDCPTQQHLLDRVYVQSELGAGSMELTADQNGGTLLDLMAFDSKDTVTVWLPFTLDLDIRYHGEPCHDECVPGRGMLKLLAMEGQIVVEVVNGDLSLQSLKTPKLRAQVTAGTLYGDTLHGDLDLTVKQGRVALGKAQATAMTVRTEQAAVDMAALYTSEHLDVAADGPVTIGALHGTSKIETVRGDITVATNEGRLQARARTGKVTVHVMKPDALDIDAGTDVQLTADPTWSARLWVQCARLEQTMVNPFQEHTNQHEGGLSKLAGVLGEFRDATNLPDVRIVAKGTVQLANRSWLQANMAGMRLFGSDKQRK